MKYVTIKTTLAGAEAWALAELVKRIAFDAVRQCAVDEDETYTMLGAIRQLRQSLAEQGFSPR